MAMDLADCRAEGGLSVGSLKQTPGPCSPAFVSLRWAADKSSRGPSEMGADQTEIM